MSVKDVIKNSFLSNDSFTKTDVEQIVVSLIAALLLGLFIYLVYRVFYAGVIYSKSFAVTIVGMTVLTCMVTLAISTNVVISLGMVGALSIVRFRTAIKDPLDLLYLFWAITAGITAGAQMYLLAVSSSIIMLVVIIIFYSRSSSKIVYVAVIHYTGDDTGDKILQELGKIKYCIKSKTLRGQETEMALEVSVRKNDLFFEEKIRNLENVKDITLIQYNGEYHG